MGTASGMVRAMQSLLGTTERPPGSNHNDVTVWYNQHVDKIGDGAWCDMTVARAADLSGNSKLVGLFAYTVYHAEWFQKQGLWHYGTKGIKPGAVVFYDWIGTGKISGIDHVGVVERVYADGSFDVIEGNMHDKCQRVRRDATYVVGFGMPKYAVPTLAAPNGTPILKLGVANSRVVVLQRCLNKTLKSGLIDDGEFGPKTKAATKHLQENRKDSSSLYLVKDGEYGEKSEWALAQALKKAS